MPIYEYKCKKCGHRFEVIQKFSDVPLRRCKSCGGRVTKLLAPSALMFKGSGWYITDYSSKSKESASKENGIKEKGKKEAVASTEKKATEKATVDANPSNKKTSPHES